MDEILGHRDFLQKYKNLYSDYLKYLEEGFSIAENKHSLVKIGINNPDILEELSIEIHSWLYVSHVKNHLMNSTLVLLNSFDTDILNMNKSLLIDTTICHPIFTDNANISIGQIVVPEKRTEVYQAMGDHIDWMTKNVLPIRVLNVADLSKHFNISAMLILSMDNGDDYFLPIKFYEMNKYDFEMVPNKERAIYLQSLQEEDHDQFMALHSRNSNIIMPRPLPHKPHCSVITTRLMEIKGKEFYNEAIFLTQEEACQPYHS